MMDLPKYPPLAKLARVTGTVELSFVISESGAPVGLTVVSGHPLLLESTVNAVKTWRFPASLSGERAGASVMFGMNCGTR